MVVIKVTSNIGEQNSKKILRLDIVFQVFEL